MATMFHVNMEKALETVSEYEKKVICQVNVVCSCELCDHMCRLRREETYCKVWSFV